jgi:GT2 family glycosyltransferase
MPDSKPKNKLLASVVTRNRPKNLDTALRLLTQQTLKPDTILIVDNDSLPDTRVLVEKWQAQFPFIRHLNTGKNGGSAGGQKAAMAYAVENNFDLLYTMDDDCEPQPDAVEQIVTAWAALPDREGWALNSLVQDTQSDALSFMLWDAQAHLPRHPRIFYWFLKDIPASKITDGLLRNWCNFFNGTLLPVSVIRKTGYPREEFFLRGDEFEYFLRTARQFQVATMVRSVVKHPRDTPATATPAKVYLETRNHAVIHRQYFSPVKFSPPGVIYKILKMCGRGLAGKEKFWRAGALGLWDSMWKNYSRDPATVR